MELKEIAVLVVAFSYLPTLLEGVFIILKTIFVQGYNPLDSDFSSWFAKAVIPWWVKPLEIASRLPSILAMIVIGIVIWMIKETEK